MSNICLVGTEAQVIAANAQIESNAGIPYGITIRWATPIQIYQQTSWYIPMPNPDAIYNGHTGIELMIGVEDVTQEEYNPSWNPTLTTI